MVNSYKLMVAIMEKNMSEEMIASAIGITTPTFRKKMSKGVFGSNEINLMQEILQFQNPTEIFFAKFVTY